MSSPVNLALYLCKDIDTVVFLDMAQNLYNSFRNFLRENDYEKQFDAAFYTQCGANYLDETLAGILVIDEFFFGRCFDWTKTPEGRDFWKEVNRRWWEVCNSPADFGN